MKIYKYELHYYTAPELVRLPKGAEVIQMDVQDRPDYRGAVMWALVDPEAEIEERVFLLAYTGADIPGEIVKVHNTITTPVGLVVTLLELKGVKGFDPEKDERLKSD